MNRSDYEAGLELLRKRMPEHPFFTFLSQGYAPGRVLYMRKAVEEAVAAPVRMKVDAAPADPELRKMYIEKSTLFTRRAKLSNQFHVCTTDAQRAKVSIRVQLVQREIEALKNRIEHYLNTGKTKTMKSDKFPVPDDPYKRLKKRNSLRSNISNYKRKLKHLAGLPDNHPDRKNIDKYETKLNNLQMHLKHVESAIEEEA